MSKNLETIYVELDALLDTRLSTLACVSEELAATVLNSGYHFREDDLFEGSLELYSKESFKELYKQRNTVTLSKSRPTDILNFVKYLVGELTEQAIARPFHDGVKIVVNVHPYKLTNEEQGEIGKAVSAWTKNIAPVELVTIHPKDLTPSHCKMCYSLMIAYEYEEWLNTQTPAFEHTRLPEVIMYVPALYIKTPTAEELRKIIKEAEHPFRAVEFLASPLIELKLIDVNYFSIVRKDDLPLGYMHIFSPKPNPLNDGSGLGEN